MIDNPSIKEKYLYIMDELRNRIIFAENLSKEKNKIMIESTALQLRMVLELISYLFVVVNQDKFNNKEKQNWSPSVFIDNLKDKISIFYPTPCYLFEDDIGEPTVIPRGFRHSLNISELKEAYKIYNNALHAFHPFKSKKISLEELLILNKNILSQSKELLSDHLITIKESDNLYSFLHTRIDFNSTKETNPTYIKQYKVNITDVNALHEMLTHEIKY